MELSLMAWIAKANPENARYMLSALVQCEATVVSIVVSLSLVALQLSASYSPRLVSIFRRSRSFWFTVILYTFTIILTLTALKLIGYKGAEILVNVSYFLSVVCFFTLIPYTLKMLNLMKLETVIDDAVKSIKKSKDLNKIYREISNIFTIIAGSLSWYDCETAVKGLRAIKTELLDYLDDDAMYHTYWQINRISSLLVNYGDEETIFESLSILGKVAETALKKDLAWIGEIVWFLEIFGKALIDRNNERITLAVLLCLKYVWEECIKTSRKRAIELVPLAAGEILKEAIKKRMKTTEEQSRKLLKKITIDSKNFNLNNIEGVVNDVLREVDRIKYKDAVTF